MASLDVILSKKLKAKALIRLCGCAGWSAPLLVATRRRQVFSRRGPCKSDEFSYPVVHFIVGSVCIFKCYSVGLDKQSLQACNWD